MGLSVATALESGAASRQSDCGKVHENLEFKLFDQAGEFLDYYN